MPQGLQRTTTELKASVSGIILGSLLGTSGSSCFTTVGTLLVVLVVPQGPKMEMLCEELVGGGLLEVLPAALGKVAGGPLMAHLSEVDLGPGVALRGATDTDNGLLCW